MASARKSIVFFWTTVCASCGISVNWDFRFKRKTRNSACTSKFMILPTLAIQATRKLWLLRLGRKKRRPIRTVKLTAEHGHHEGRGGAYGVELGRVGLQNPPFRH